MDLAGLVDLDDGASVSPIGLISTSTTETVDVTDIKEAIVRQTASGITTSVTGHSLHTIIHIKNRGGGTNTINLTVDGASSPTILDGEAFSLYYNGTDWDLI